MAKIRALGTTISFGDTPIGKISSIGEVNVSSDEIDVTTLDSASGWREFLQGFKDSGELPISGFFDKADAGQLALRTGFGSGTAATVLITFPDLSTVSFSAFVKGFTVGPAEVDGAVGFAAVLRGTGAVTVNV